MRKLNRFRHRKCFGFVDRISWPSNESCLSGFEYGGDLIARWGVCTRPITVLMKGPGGEFEVLAPGQRSTTPSSVNRKGRARCPHRAAESGGRVGFAPPHPGALGTALPYLLVRDAIVPNVTRCGGWGIAQCSHRLFRSFQRNRIAGKEIPLLVTAE